MTGPEAEERSMTRYERTTVAIAAELADALLAGVAEFPEAEELRESLRGWAMTCRRSLTDKGTSQEFREQMRAVVGKVERGLA